MPRIVTITGPVLLFVILAGCAQDKVYFRLVDVSAGRAPLGAVMAVSCPPFGNGFCTVGSNAQGVVSYSAGDPMDFELGFGRVYSFGSPSYDGYAATRVKVGMRYVTIQPPRGATTAPTNSDVPLRVLRCDGETITVPLYKATAP
jgi:hypothetical protein